MTVIKVGDFTIARILRNYHFNLKLSVAYCGKNENTDKISFKCSLFVD